MCKHAMLSFGVLVEDLLGRFMYISQKGLFILPTYMNSYLVILVIFLSLPFTHVKDDVHQRFKTPCFKVKNRTEVYFSLCICAV